MKKRHTFTKNPVNKFTSNIACIKHLQQIKAFILLALCIFFHASTAQEALTCQPNGLRFTYAPTPYNMNNQLYDMNFRTNALEAHSPKKQKPSGKPIIIASAQPSTLALEKIKTALSQATTSIKGLPLNIVDLRREPHFYIHIINSPTIILGPLDGGESIGQYDLAPGWYSLSAKETPLETKAIEACQNNYSQIIQCMQPSPNGKGYNEIKAETLFVKYRANPAMIHYDQIISEKDFFEKVVKKGVPHFSGNIKYHHSCIKDFSSFTKKETHLLETQINRFINNQESVWIHCWGGQGRTSQYLGLYYFLQEKNQTADTLLGKVQLFNNGRNMFEEPEQEDYVRQLGSKTQRNATLPK